MKERRAFAASGEEWCYHAGELVRMGDVRLSPATHALNYGTGVFEGIRAYWSECRSAMQVLKMRYHYYFFEKSATTLIYTLSLHVALPCRRRAERQGRDHH